MAMGGSSRIEGAGRAGVEDALARDTGGLMYVARSYEGLREVRQLGCGGHVRSAG